MVRPLAYLLTWTCYGTWLHGDERGSVDRDHNAPLTPFLPADSRLQRASGSRLRHEPLILRVAARRVVHETITVHCQHRGWELIALNVRSNHVHVVVNCGDCSPENALSQFKAWCTRRLREARLVSAETRPWTNHGSTRYLWDESAVAGAAEYVEERQGSDV